MASRIVVFPVIGRRWAFGAAIPHAGANGAAGEAAAAPLKTMTLREFWENLKAAPRMQEKTDLLTDFVSDKMHAQYTAWEAAPEKSIRRRLHSIGQRMLSRLSPSELFLKSIPKSAESVEIVYPNCVNPRLVRRRVRHLATSGEVIHRRYMYGSIALLPFTAIFGLLPLPNVVMGWNLFRAYSHWRALQGSRRLTFLVTESGVVSSPTKSNVEEDKSERGDPISSEKFAEGAQPELWVFHPSEILETLLVGANVPKDAINDGTVEEICKEYMLDPHEVLKWRDNKLPIKSFG